MMEQPQFLHFMRHQLRELQFLISLPFVQFWFELLKDSKLIEFFDSVLLTLRKFKDTYKLQLVAETRKAHSFVKTDNTEVEDLINRVLEAVLQIFHRVSLA